MEEKHGNAVPGYDPKAGRFSHRRTGIDNNPTIKFCIEDPLQLNQETEKRREGKMLYGSFVV